MQACLTLTSTPPSNEMLLERFWFFLGKNQIDSVSKRKKKWKRPIRLYWNGLALHPRADFSQLFTHPPFAAPPGLLKAGNLWSTKWGRGSAGGKNGPVGVIRFIPGPGLKAGYLQSLTPFPPPAGLEPWKTTSDQARLGPRSALGCCHPAAPRPARKGPGLGVQEDQKHWRAPNSQQDSKLGGWGDQSPSSLPPPEAGQRHPSPARALPDPGPRARRAHWRGLVTDRKSVV